MPRRSTIQDHPHRDAMLALRREGRTIESIADQFDVGEESLKRWLRKNVGEDSPRAPQTSAADREPRGRADRRPARPNVPRSIPDDPVDTFHDAFGQDAMPHQVEYLRETSDLVACKGRQIGFTQAAAALAIHVARSGFGPEVVIVSPSQRQSSEVALRARNGLWRLGEDLAQDSASVVRLDNGSRIVSLAGTPRSVRGYSARMLIVDEAAFVDDETWAAARPTTSATRGRTIVQSTPGLPVGWFWELWSDPAGFATMRVPSAGIIDPEFLERERERLTPQVFQMEYGADFAAVAAAGAWFDDDGYEARVNDTVKAFSILKR